MREIATYLTGAKVQEVMTGSGTHYEVISLGDEWDPSDPRVTVESWGISDE